MVLLYDGAYMLFARATSAYDLMRELTTLRNATDPLIVEYQLTDARAYYVNNQPINSVWQRYFPEYPTLTGDIVITALPPGGEEGFTANLVLQLVHGNRMSHETPTFNKRKLP